MPCSPTRKMEQAQLCGSALPGSTNSPSDRAGPAAEVRLRDDASRCRLRRLPVGVRYRFAHALLRKMPRCGFSAIGRPRRRGCSDGEHEDDNCHRYPSIASNRRTDRNKIPQERFQSCSDPVNYCYLRPTALTRPSPPALQPNPIRHHKQVNDGGIFLA